MSAPLYVTTWPSLRQPIGSQLRTTWESLAARAKCPRVGGVQKHALARWAPARFVENYRRLANVIDLGALVADVDVDTTREQIGALGHLCGFAHGTSTPGHWRIVVRPSRIILASEYQRVWRAFAIAAERAGLVLDYAASDASRAWAVPAIPVAGGLYEFAEFDGALFDVDAALEEIPEPAGPVPIVCAPASDDARKWMERARAYVATCDPAISGSGGHAATFRVAMALVRGFELDETDALALLEEYSARCQPPWSPWELRHKVRSAMARGRREPGWLAYAQRRAS